MEAPNLGAIMEDVKEMNDEEGGHYWLNLPTENDNLFIWWDWTPSN